jgi:hypothetical protein
MTALSDQAGRVCPLDYRYRPQDIANAALHPDLQGLDALWVVGGLYGNLDALDALLTAFRDDEVPRKALVFNGDFHWFDAEADWFADIQAEVDRHWATRGNVETELGRSVIGEAGCGCGYPEWVGQDTVAHSNRIIQRLHAVVPAALRERLTALPLYLRAEVAGMPIAIVHGDAHSLAGWGFAREVMQHSEARQAARQACDDAGVRGFCSSHTCLPVAQDLGEGRWLMNNGAAGMPNAAGDLRGLCTRIARTPPHSAVEVHQEGDVYLSLQALAYDTSRWWQRFEQCWPAGSDAHLSYGQRMRQGCG